MSKKVFTAIIEFFMPWVPETCALSISLVAIVYQTKLANIVHHLCDFFRVHVLEDLRGGVKSGK